MWVKLNNEHLNLDRILRVRFNQGWRNGQEELVAEIESLIHGEVQVFARYRGSDAELLQALLEKQAGPGIPVPVLAGDAPPLPRLESAFVPCPTSTNTLHDL